MNKKIILFVILSILILSLVGSAYAEKDKSSSETSSKKSSSVTKEEKSYKFVDENQNEIQVTLRRETKTRGDNVYEKIKVRGVEAVSPTGIEEEHEETELKRLKFKFSNGNYKDIKIMPNTASEIAIQKLKTNKNLTIQLKEVGEGNNLSVVYDIEGNKTTKLLGLFKVRTTLTARINAETGELLEFETPWWYFLVGKEILVPECDLENLELCVAEEECSTAGGYWYYELCNSEPQIVINETQPVNSTII